jgi:hypothetical protein
VSQRAALLGMATCKAGMVKLPGPDNLPIASYKNIKKSSPKSSNILCDAPKQLLNCIIDCQHPAEDFSVGVLSLLYKDKGLLTDLKDYCPLTVTNAEYKIFTSIPQSAFRPLWTV